MPPTRTSPLFNKHVVAALIVTPILAIIAWLSIDYTLREKPHAAVAGQAYELVALPNCRYQSGRCSLKNGDIKVDLEMTSPPTGDALITLQSSLPLDGVRLALIKGESEAGTARSMHHSNSERTRWQLPAPPTAPDQSRLRVAISANQALYFAEVPTLFSEYHTPFGRDFRRAKEAPAPPPIINANTL